MLGLKPFQKLLQILQSTVLNCQIQVFSEGILKFQLSYLLTLFKKRYSYVF